MTFQERLLAAIARTGITDLQLRREFGVSKPTLERWKNGKSAPHPLGQPAVFGWLDRLPTRHEHEFAFGEMTEQEKMEGGVSVVICKNCPLRVCRSGLPLTKADLKWAKEVAARLDKMPNKP